MSNKISKENQFVIDNRVVTVYLDTTANRSVAYLNTFAEEGSSVYQTLRDGGCPDFTGYLPCIPCIRRTIFQGL